MTEFIPIPNAEGNYGCYDDLAEEIYRRTHAKGVLLIIANGDRGTGFSAAVPQELIAPIPKVLREVADKIEAQAKAAGI